MTADKPPKSKVELKLDWCSYEAAKYAVEHWHYSRVLPAGKLVKVGVWEDKQFIGAVIFGRGANNHIGTPYGLSQDECAELVRVALTEHSNPVSKIVAVALRLLKKQSPGLRLVVSYADPEQGHNGSIYQAGNWVCVGQSKAQREKVEDGKIVHKRSVFARNGTAGGGEYSKLMWKHKYLMPLDDEMRRQIEPLRKPYPKRAPDSGTSPQEKQAGQV